jgi:hypothetical protein
MTNRFNVNEKPFRIIDKLDTGHVWQLKNSPSAAFLTIGTIAKDWDGHPMAYGDKRKHPEISPKDHLGNGGHNGNWWGVVTNTRSRTGTPIEQSGNKDWFGNGPMQPYRNYMISTTKLVDISYPEDDVRRWVDAATIPYVALPNSRKSMNAVHLKTGCSCALVDLQTLNYCFAIYADSKATTPRMGEISARACDILGNENGSVLIMVFPQSGRGQGTIPYEAVIQSQGRELLKQYSIQDANNEILAAFENVPGLNGALIQAGYEWL